MDYFTLGEPQQQFGDMPDINRKFHTSSFATAEACDLPDNDSGDCAKTPVRLFDLARDLIFQSRVVHRLNVFESPESAVQPGKLFFRKSKLNQCVNISVVRQVAHLGSQKITEVLVPPVA